MPIVNHHTQQDNSDDPITITVVASTSGGDPTGLTLPSPEGRVPYKVIQYMDDRSSQTQIGAEVPGKEVEHVFTYVNPMPGKRYEFEAHYYEGSMRDKSTVIHVAKQ